MRILLLAGGEVSAVGCAGDVQSGLKYIQTYHPALVILDAGLLGGNTWTALERIRQGWPQIRTIVLAHTFAQEEQARAAQADAVLQVGFSAQSLYHLVHTLLSGDRSQ